MIYEPVQYLKGVGSQRAKLLAKLGIHTIMDLMEHIPRSYIYRNLSAQINDLKPETFCSITCIIVEMKEKFLNRSKKQLSVTVSDGTNNMTLTWFRYGKWITEKMRAGNQIWISGLVKDYKGGKQIIHPEFELLENFSEMGEFWKKRSVLPVYHLTEGLTSGHIRKMIYNAFFLYHKEIEDNLSHGIISKYRFFSRKATLEKLHFPTEKTNIEQVTKRLKYEELFYHQLMFARNNLERKMKPAGITHKVTFERVNRLKNSLPFELTGAQKKVLNEILDDMLKPFQMNRLIQGDVGSGKTIVTVLAMLAAVESGYQAAMMAPTEILAEQHYKSMRKLLSSQEKIIVTLLKGGNYKGKKEQKKVIAEGGVDIVVGTHALIQKDVKFARLGLICVDEQHRFGVQQRAVLAEQKELPDVIHLSATPIPRSLAMTMYGDLELSIIDELPPTRQPIKTYWKSGNRKKTLYKDIAKELKKGRQAYFVCPLIEESEKMDLLAADKLYEQLKEEVYTDYNIGLLHGKMKNAEKDEIMVQFKDKKIDVLVATTVIEVGIDVPNASVMVIEHAERFGLSQLHQLRGRIGRGEHESFCYLIAYPPISENSRKRLNSMVETSDGFVISERDLEIRGPGDFFGTEQSGMPIFKFANIVKDQEILQASKLDAFSLVRNDIDLRNPENKDIAAFYKMKYEDKEKLYKF